VGQGSTAAAGRLGPAPQAWPYAALTAGILSVSPGWALLLAAAVAIAAFLAPMVLD
jgi:hypothetical protein